MNKAISTVSALYRLNLCVKSLKYWHLLAAFYSVNLTIKLG